MQNKALIETALELIYAGKIDDAASILRAVLLIFQIDRSANLSPRLEDVHAELVALRKAIG